MSSCRTIEVQHAVKSNWLGLLMDLRNWKEMGSIPAAAWSRIHWRFLITSGSKNGFPGRGSMTKTSREIGTHDGDL